MEQAISPIIHEMERYMRGSESNPANWHVGISRDADNCLSRIHRVNRRQDPWIYATASTSTEAREIRDYFLRTLGAKAEAANDGNATMVYAFLKTPYTPWEGIVQALAGKLKHLFGDLNPSVPTRRIN